MAEISGRLNRLLEAGLNEYQARVYLALLDQGETEASALSEASRVPRTRIYETCRGLEEKGLVEASLGRPVKYRALPIRAYLEQRAHEHRRRAEEIAAKIAHISEEFTPAESAPSERSLSLHKIQGPKRIEAKLRDMLARARREINVTASPIVLEWLIAQIAREAPAEGVPVRVVAHVTAENVAAVRSANRLSVRHAREAFDAATIVIDGREAMDVYGAPDKRATAGLAFWTRSPDLVTHWGASVRNAWELAVPLERRVAELETGEGPEVFFHVTRGEAEAREMVQRLSASASSRGLAFWAPPDAIEYIRSFQSAWGEAKPRLLTFVDERNRALFEAQADAFEIRHSDLAIDHLLSVAGGTAFLTFFMRSAGKIETDTVVASASPRFVRSQRDLYNLVWSHSIPLADRLRHLRTGEVPAATQIQRGPVDLHPIMLNFTSDARESLDGTMTPAGPIRATHHPTDVWRARGLRVRLVAEITPENLAAARKLRDLGFEVRHSPIPIRSSISLKDGRACLCHFGESDTPEPATKRRAQSVITSTDPALVEVAQASFNGLWEQGIPLATREEELRTGARLPTTRVFHGPVEIHPIALKFTSDIERSSDVILSESGLLRAIQHPIGEWRARGIKRRYLAPITPRNAHAARRLAELGHEVRHAPMPVRSSLAVKDGTWSLFHGETTDPPDVLRATVPSAILSSDPALVEISQASFDGFWEQAVPLSERLKELAGEPPERTRVITDPAQADRALREFLDGAARALDIIFPEAGTHRLAATEGSLLRAAARRVRAKIATPVTKTSLSAVETLVRDGFEIRHVEVAVKAAVIVRDDRDCVILAAGPGEGDSQQMRMIHSSSMEFTSVQKGLFDGLWEAGTPFATREKDLRTGVRSGTTRFLRDHADIRRYVEEAAAVTRESVDVIVPGERLNPTSVAYVRSARKSGAKVRLLCHVTPTTQASALEAAELGVEVRHTSVPLRETESIVDRVRVFRLQYAPDDRQIALPPVGGILTEDTAIVESEQVIFDALWADSIPLEVRLRELAGQSPSGEVRILRGKDEITAEGWGRLHRAEKSVVSCLTPTVAEALADASQEIRAAVDRGVHVRYLMTVTLDTAGAARKLSAVGAEIRHVPLVDGVIRAVIDGAASLIVYLDQTASEDPSYPTTAIIATDALLVRNEATMFERAWSSAEPLEARLASLARGETVGEIRAVRGVPAILEGIDRFADDIRERVLVFLPANHFGEAEQARVRALIARGVRVELIGNVGRASLPGARALAAAGAQVRHYPSPQNVYWAFADGVRSLAIYYGGGAGEPAPTLAIRSDDETHVENELRGFRAIWEHATPLATREAELSASGLRLPHHE